MSVITSKNIHKGALILMPYGPQGKVVTVIDKPLC